MPDTELTSVFTVAAAPADVAAHLAEPANYVGLSPLVVAVRDVVREAGLTRYTAVERFRFLGFLRHDNRIAVTIRTTGSTAVHGEVVSPGGVRMGYRFDLEPDGGGTRVTDTLRLHAPPGLLRFAASQARAVQLARAGVLADRLG
ncbi:SRPBCC family protein [Amycolatopsis sp. NPDC051903]|uniref:SRPBCC family protein n=1 Tax=Amycolatopsis sp. NPDC051903 TaxID=3363936 RepID=UPI0037A151B0